MKIILSIVCLSLLSACSSANWYQAARSSAEVECRKQPAAQYEECVRGYDKTYNEYSKQREQAIQK